MTAPAVRSPVLQLSGHPLQRGGAWALTLLAGRETPQEVSPEDFGQVIDQIADDVVSAAIAGKDSPGYDWWKVLFALYPNAEPTHARRTRDRAELLGSVMALFAADVGGGRLLPCTFCATPCGAVWAKARMPMFDSTKALNTLPPGVAGWPVCRACRVSLWALPYGASVTAGSATVLTCDDPAVERAFARSNVRRAARIRQLGFDGLGASAGPEAVTLHALREHAHDAGVSATLWMFKNDNQEPWLRVSSARVGVSRFLRAMRADPRCVRGWAALRRSLVRRDASGTVTLDGSTAAARTLFDRDGGQSDRLPVTLKDLADPAKVPHQTLLDWGALCRLYLEVMHDMKSEQLRPVTVLLADWMQKESTRGRFNEFCSSVAKPYDLTRLMTRASARLILDGRDQEVVSDRLLEALTAGGPQGWRTRAQLYFDVVAELDRREVRVGAEAKQGDQAHLDQEADELFPPTDEDEDHS